jgi:hypothetical protein
LVLAESLKSTDIVLDSTEPAVLSAFLVDIL